MLPVRLVKMRYFVLERSLNTYCVFLSSINVFNIFQTDPLPSFRIPGRLRRDYLMIASLPTSTFAKQLD